MPSGSQRAIFGLRLVYLNCGAEYQLENSIRAADSALTAPSLAPQALLSSTSHDSHTLNDGFCILHLNIWCTSIINSNPFTCVLVKQRHNGYLLLATLVALWRATSVCCSIDFGTN